jgi:hypothetical protein
MPNRSIASAPTSVMAKTAVKPFVTRPKLRLFTVGRTLQFTDCFCGLIRFLDAAPSLVTLLVGSGQRKDMRP